MVDLLAFTKIFLLSTSIDMGVMPGHDMTMYDAVTTQNGSLRVNQAFYTDYSTDLCISKYFCASGGMRCYFFSERASILEFYPFRMDFHFGGSLMYKIFEVGIKHECDHPIAPSANHCPLPEIDFHQDRFYGKAVIDENISRIFNLRLSLEAGFVPAYNVYVYQKMDEQDSIPIHQTFYPDLQTKIGITKFGFIGSGIKCYLPNKRQPFDFNLGTGLRYKNVELGWKYGRDKPMAADGSELPLPRLDSRKHEFYLCATLGKSWRK